MVVRWRSSSTPYLYMPAGQLEFWSGRGRSPPDNSDKIARPCCVCNGGKLLHSFGQRVGTTLCWSDIAVHANYNYTLQNKNITQRLGWLAQGYLTFARVQVRHRLVEVPEIALTTVMAVSTSRIISAFYAHPAAGFSREGVQALVKTTTTGVEITITGWNTQRKTEKIL